MNDVSCRACAQDTKCDYCQQDVKIEISSGTTTKNTCGSSDLAHRMAIDRDFGFRSNGPLVQDVGEAPDD